MTLNESIELVSISLNEYIETKFKKEKNNVSETLASAMKYSLKAGGKRIRPVLAFASLTVLKKQNLSIILPLMLALEMLHTYSLIHDDLPAMDDDDLRRGKPSNHKIYGEAVAILAGDALLTEVFTELSKLKKNFKAENVIDAISYFVNCAGMKGMVDGQVLDIANDSSKKIDNRKTLDEIYLKKTGALIRASVTIPAILLGEDIEPFEIYGNKIGQAFQIIDDIIGIIVFAGIGYGAYKLLKVQPLYFSSAVCKKYGIELNFNTDVIKKTENCLGRKRSFNMLRPLVEADFIINLSKLKTHGMMVFTGAVKNMFGSIAGIEKATHHMNMPDYNAFADNIIDICETIKPGLSIMDGILAMEGNGPSAGNPRRLDVIVASKNPYLVDMAAHDIINLDVADSYILYQAKKRGVDLEYIAVGDDISEFVCPDFSIPFKKSMGITKKGILNRGFMTYFKSKPVVDKNVCIGCAICKNNCPAEAIVMKNGIPNFDYKNCIRCFCCQELCPEHAISIKDSFLIKLLATKRK